MPKIKKPFFQQYGNEIKFISKSDLITKLSNINYTVPKRTKGRTSDHRERHSLVVYLLRLAENNLLKFPLKIEKSESPDFLVLNYDGTTTALEETEATTEDYSRALTEFENSPDGTMLDPSLFKLVKSPLQKGEYKKALLKPGQVLSGDMWFNGDEKGEWVEVVLKAIIV